MKRKAEIQLEKTPIKRIKLEKTSGPNYESIKRSNEEFIYHYKFEFNPED